MGHENVLEFSQAQLPSVILWSAPAFLLRCWARQHTDLWNDLTRFGSLHSDPTLFCELIVIGEGKLIEGPDRTRSHDASSLSLIVKRTNILGVSIIYHIYIILHINYESVNQFNCTVKFYQELSRRVSEIYSW
jgi:hypothetical protein